MNMAQVNAFPLVLSLKTALMSTVIVFVIALVFSYICARKDFPGKSVLEAIFLLPLILPPTVVGFALLYLFGKTGPLGKLLNTFFGIQIVFTWYGVLIAAIVVSFPLMYQAAVASFSQYDSKVEQAARTLGKTRLQVFWTISLPLAWPGLLAGTVLAFARGLGEFGATLMVAGYIPNVTETIPLAIYFAVETGNYTVAQFWGVLIVIIGFAATLWLNWWSKRSVMKYRR